MPKLKKTTEPADMEYIPGIEERRRILESCNETELIYLARGTSPEWAEINHALGKERIVNILLGEEELPKDYKSPVYAYRAILNKFFTRFRNHVKAECAILLIPDACYNSWRCNDQCAINCYIAIPPHVKDKLREENQ